ncbi:hypothetical protein LAZ67_8001515 [Cordylochernes scorpioides]|uniref:Uncharacterized protein n=1 Tax=Cordylochernes scorpioides TaxID=51811 RepID=A0ABY6KQS5_9ARAC|nr:hypothetical protein LAZ67_8001515 [Cordylochernes scorpioides]
MHFADYEEKLDRLLHRCNSMVLEGNREDRNRQDLYVCEYGPVELGRYPNLLSQLLNANAIRKALQSDEDLSKLIQKIQNDIVIFYEYTLENGILFKGH